MMIARACSLTALLLAAAGLPGCAKDWTPPDSDLAVPDARAQITRAAALFRQAEEMEEAGRPVEAIRLYREAIGAYREYPAAWHNLGVLVLSQDEGLGAMDAVSAFQTAADLDQTDPRSLYNIGVIYQERQRLAEASTYYNQALERDPNYLPALRYSIYVDQVRDMGTHQTADRLHRALLIERDPRFLEWMQRQQLLLSAKLASTGRPGSRTPP